MIDLWFLNNNYINYIKQTNIHMSTIDYNNIQNTNKKSVKKEESTRTLKTAVSATDLRKLYS